MNKQFNMNKTDIKRRLNFVKDLNISEDDYSRMIFEFGVMICDADADLSPEMTKSNLFWYYINEEFVRIEKYFEIKKEYLPNLYIDENGVYSFDIRLFRPMKRVIINEILEDLKKPQKRSLTPKNVKP